MLLRLRLYSYQCKAGLTMGGNQQLGKQLETREQNWGKGSKAGGVFLSSPCLAGPIFDWLNMTELTLLSVLKGKRKINRIETTAQAI